MNKKAQSEIITTILIILLVLAAIVIVWQVISRTVQSGGQQVSDQSTCIGVSMEVTKAIAGQTSVIVRRGQGSSDTVVTGYKVYVNGAKVTDKTTNLNPLDTDTALLTVDASTAAGATPVTLAANNKVEVSPVIGKVTCNPSTYFMVK